MGGFDGAWDLENGMRRVNFVVVNRSVTMLSLASMCMNVLLL